MKKEFAELSYVAHQPNRDTEATNRVLEKVQREFESFDKGSQEESCPGKNISILTKERYECFAKEVNNIAPKWLTDDYRRNTLDPFVAEYGASDLNVKWTSAEIGLFAGAFRHKVRISAQLSMEVERSPL